MTDEENVRNIENNDMDSTEKVIITYNENGGSDAPSVQIVKITDKIITISKEKPSRNGYEFMGWSTSKNATEATYVSGQSINNPKKNLELFAIWQQIKHVVTNSQSERNENNQKDLALLLALQQEIQRKIANSIRENKEKVNIDFFGDNVIINVKLLEDISEYEKQYEFEEESRRISGIAREKDGKIDVDVDFNDEKIKTHVRQDSDRREIRSDIHDARKHTVQKGDQNALSKEIEIGLVTGDTVRMDLDREFSSSENMRMFVKRAWKVDAKEIYRVKGKDRHDFKYVAKTGNSKEPYQEID